MQIFCFIQISFPFLLFQHVNQISYYTNVNDDLNQSKLYQPVNNKLQSGYTVECSRSDVLSLSGRLIWLRYVRVFVVCSGFVSGQFSAFSAFTFLIFTGDCFPSQCFSVRFYPAPYVSRWSCLCGVKLPTVTSGTRLSVCRRIIVDGPLVSTPVSGV